MRPVLYLGKFIGFCGVMLLASGIAGYPGPWETVRTSYSSEQRVEHIIIGLFLLIIGKLIIYDANQSEQKRRNTNAQVISEDNGYGDFVLYLRPFTSTGRILLINPFSNKGDYDFTGVGEDSTIDFENLLIRTNKSKIQLIALGGEVENLGAGKIQTSDENWLVKFKQLATCAKFIIILPSYHLGTFSELEWLYSKNLISKVVFVRPFIGTVIDEIEIHEYWQRTRDKVATIGFELPEYENGGGLFIYDGERFTKVFESPYGFSFPKVYEIVRENTDNYKTPSKINSSKLILEKQAIKMGICSVCRVYVLSTSEGKCPSCRNNFNEY